MIWNDEMERLSREDMEALQLRRLQAKEIGRAHV